MTEEKIVQILKQSGALLTGHFQLRSGLHSDQFFQAALLLQYPDTRFLVCGYTDSVGSDEYNAALSRDRAKAVWQALVNRGVPAGRLAWRGFGNRVALMPPSASEEQRRVDRKVVLERIQDEATWDYLTK